MATHPEPSTRVPRWARRALLLHLEKLVWIGEHIGALSEHHADRLHLILADALAEVERP